MATVLLVLVVVLVIGGLVFGVVSLLSGDDPGLVPAEPDGRARPLPNDRSLREDDLKAVRFDIALRGYRMAQVDRMLRRTAYDLGYKDEMIAVLEAEVAALREGRSEDADVLRKARESASGPSGAQETTTIDRAWAPKDAADEESAPGPDEAESEVEVDEESSAAAALDPDRTDDAPADAEPDLPREGSLRRREPVAADAVAHPDGGVAIDVADRPAHA
jgi:DivIVA domain-containing protein